MKDGLEQILKMAREVTLQTLDSAGTVADTPLAMIAPLVTDDTLLPLMNLIRCELAALEKAMEILAKDIAQRQYDVKLEIVMEAERKRKAGMN